MKVNVKKALAAVAACAVAASAVSYYAFADDSVPATGDTSKYPDSAEITAALGTGWNLGNQLEASIGGNPSETAWGNPTIKPEIFAAVKNAGFDSVRIPVSYLNKIGDAESGYKIDEAWLDRVQEVVDYALAEDLYVVINMHGDGYHTVDGGWLFCDAKDQTEIKAKYESCWTQIAEKFKDYDGRLIFESMNEEHDGSYGNPKRDAYNNINDYNQIFVDTVRSTGSNNGDRWLLVPGWNTNIDQTVNTHGYVEPYFGFVLPDDSNCTADSNRLMVSVHYYDPWGFCGTENGDVTQWGEDADPAKKDTYGQEDYLDTQFKKLYDKFTSNGVPVIIGEMGAIDKSKDDAENPAFREKWYGAAVTKAIEYGCVPVVWDNGWNGDYGFGLFNRRNSEITQQGIIDAINSAAANAEFIGYPGGDDSSVPDDSSSEPDSSSEVSTPDPTPDSSSESGTDSTSSSEVDSSSTASSSSAASSAASSSKATSSAAANTTKDTSPNTGVGSGALAGIAIICTGAVLTVAKKRK